MKHPVGHAVRSLFAALLLVLICCRSASANDVVCDSNDCVNLNTFLANIASKLDKRVAGYVIIVGNLPPFSGGRARRTVDSFNNDGGLDMSPDLTMNIASVSKTLTAVAILQSLTSAGLTPDAKIWPFLYSDWQTDAGLYINQITFRELLTHTSGFGQLGLACANGNAYAQLKMLVAGGVQSGTIGNQAYGNCNFALLRELMPALTGQVSKIKGSDAERAKNSMDIYTQYMNDHIFAPLGIPARYCKALTVPNQPKQILSYPFMPNTKRGDNWGDETVDNNGSGWCGSSGWNLSAIDVFQVLNDLANGNVLLTNNDKQQMTSGYLGWDNAVGRNCPGPNLCKNGDYPDFVNGISVWAYAGIFKSQIPVVVFVNSPLPSLYQSYNPLDGTPV
jgi:CubicO group peptidase (beta-lactamase class C family)